MNRRPCRQHHFFLEQSGDDPVRALGESLQRWRGATPERLGELRHRQGAHQQRGGELRQDVASGTHKVETNFYNYVF